MEDYDTGLGTTPGMWEMLSDLLNGEKLPESLNNAIYKLRSDEAYIVEKAREPKNDQKRGF
jgi:hypothetical protein